MQKKFHKKAFSVGVP